MTLPTGLDERVDFGGPRSAVGAEYEHAACGLLTTTADGTIERVNATLCSWIGIRASELVGRRFQTLLSVGSRLFHQTHWAPLLAMQGSVAEVQLELLHRDGRVLPMLVNAARRGGSAGDGELVDVALFVAADRRKYERELLVARRRAEELLERTREAEERSRQREIEFRSLAENSPDVIVRFGADRRMVYVNRSVELATGKPRDFFLSRRIDELEIPHPIADAWRAAVEEAFGGHDATLSLTYPAADGSHRVLQSHIVPERDARGEVVSVLAISRDITLLRRQEAEAQERARLSEQLIGIVSHDLRNPLNAVVLGAHVLGAAELGAHGKTVRRILSAAERANRLIGDLLDFTQARLGGGLPITRSEIDLHGVVADCLDEVKMAWPGRMIQHRRHGEGTGSADPDRIAQVVTNLVNNALVYGAAAEPVTVTTHVGDTDLAMHVHNAGAPIPKELEPQIFEPLRRGEHQVRLGSRSVGLGLYIVREIALAHGGKVDVRSSANEGTTFALTIPRRIST